MTNRFGKPVRIDTQYEIGQVEDGRIVAVPAPGYGSSDQLFSGVYRTLEEVDAAIMEHGSMWEEYIVMTVKRIVGE